jgi:hypothetical protein
MTRLESGGSVRTMKAGFRENSVYLTSYTLPARGPTLTVYSSVAVCMAMPAWIFPDMCNPDTTVCV